jgi:hypothetical protein
MSMLMQLLIGREIAKRSGIEDNAGQTRIGALAAVVPNPVLGLVVAKVASDREAPARATKPDEGTKPAPSQPEPAKPEPEKPVGNAPPAAIKSKA